MHRSLVEGAESFRIDDDPAIPTALYAGTGDGVFRSTDGGGSWSDLNPGLTGFTVQTLAIDPQTSITVYAGTWGGGVFHMQQPELNYRTYVPLILRGR